MFCPSCGALIDDGISFCTQCGSSLNNFTQTQNSYPTTEEQTTQSFNENEDYIAEMDAPSSQDAYQYTEPAYTSASQYSQGAPAYNQVPPMYQSPQPMYNQYQNPPTYNQPGYIGYATPYAGVERPRRDPGKVLGILSLIFSLVGYPFLLAYGAGLIYWLAALITGGIGLKLSKRNGFKNGRAKAGIIITLIPLIVTVAIGVVCGGAFLIGLLLEEMGII